MIFFNTTEFLLALATCSCGFHSRCPCRNFPSIQFGPGPVAALVAFDATGKAHRDE
ncbi:protein of unknown function [Pararobbsia alpina]